jgi:hypothetical protein
VTSPALTMTAWDAGDQDQADREKVYAAERSLPAVFGLLAISDDRAGALISQHLGQPGYIVRLDSNPDNLFGFWRDYPGLGRIPVIVAPRYYPLRHYEVAHETSHLITDRDGPRLGHGPQFIQAYLHILRRHTGLRDALQERFEVQGLTAGTAAGSSRLHLPRLASDSGIAGTPLQRAWIRFKKAVALISAGIGDIAVGPVPQAEPDRGNQPTWACFPHPVTIRGPRAGSGRNREFREVPATDQAIRPPAKEAH